MRRIKGYISLICLTLISCFSLLASGGVEVLRVPGGGILPDLAVDDGGVLHLIYFKGEASHGDVYYVRSGDYGRSFSKPVRVNSQPASAIAAGTVRAPHLALGRNGLVHVAWMGSSKAEPRAPAGEAPMLYTRLRPDGLGFEPQRNVLQVKTGVDGGGSLAADPNGNVWVMWHAPGGASHSEAERQIWVAASSDDGERFSVEESAWDKATGVCACCGMRAFADGDGRVYVLYRSADGSGTRDVYLLISEPGGKNFKGVRVQVWPVESCVMSTAAFWGDERGVLAAWETEQQVFFGEISPALPKLNELVPAPGQGANRKHPALARNAQGQTLLVWTEGAAWRKGGRLHWQVFDRELRPLEGFQGVREDLPVWDRPAAFTRADGTFVILY